MNSEIPWEREGMSEIGTVPIFPSDQEELLKKAQEAYGKALATRRMKIICDWWDSAIGAYAGGGIGFFGTNASNVTQLGGPFKTISIDLGNGLEGISVQIAWSGSTVIFSITPPLPYLGVGVGVAITTLPTITYTTGVHPL